MYNGFKAEQKFRTVSRQEYDEFSNQVGRARHNSKNIFLYEFIKWGEINCLSNTERESPTLLKR